MEQNLKKALERCSKPYRVCLVVINDRKNNRYNITTVGWKMWTSSTPRMIAVSIAQTRYAHELLMLEQECVIAWPGEDMTAGILLCGSQTGRDIDKFKETGWTPIPAQEVKAPLIKECVVNLECWVKESLVTGDHTIFVAEVVDGHVSKDNRKLLFSIGDEIGLKHVGGGKGYRFAAFS